MYFVSGCHGMMVKASIMMRWSSSDTLVQISTGANATKGFCFCDFKPQRYTIYTNSNTCTCILHLRRARDLHRAGPAASDNFFSFLQRVCLGLLPRTADGTAATHGRDSSSARQRRLQRPGPHMVGAVTVPGPASGGAAGFFYPVCRGS